ncbi:MAG: hypothetical protein ACKVH8_24425, partial [Pirellulales bacterium]
MAFGHTDDVPNAVVPEVPPTPESSSLSPNLKVRYPKHLTPICLKNAQLQNSRFGLRFMQMESSLTTDRR